MKVGPPFFTDSNKSVKFVFELAVVFAKTSLTLVKFSCNCFASFDAILNAPDVITKTVYVKQWGGYVIISKVSSQAMNLFNERFFTETKQKSDEAKQEIGYMAGFLAACLVDENGELLFKTFEDAKALAKKSHEATNFVFQEAQEFNGMGVKIEKNDLTGEETAISNTEQAIEEEVKN